MTRYLLPLLASFALTLAACQEDEPTPDCNTLATVRNLSGLDGCGWVLELENGEYLEPFLYSIDYADPLWCGLASVDAESQPYYDPELWYDVAPQDGMIVRMAYKVLPDQASACMVGPIVEITCLEVVERPPSDQPSR